MFWIRRSVLRGLTSRATWIHLCDTIISMNVSNYIYFPKSIFLKCPGNKAAGISSYNSWNNSQNSASILYIIAVVVTRISWIYFLWSIIRNEWDCLQVFESYFTDRPFIFSSSVTLLRCSSAHTSTRFFLVILSAEMRVRNEPCGMKLWSCLEASCILLYICAHRSSFQKKDS